MKFYPVRVPLDYYGGRDPRKLAKRDEYNRTAIIIEAHLNKELAELADDEIRIFLSNTVAREIGKDADLVRRIINGIDGGSNGVTICKGDFDRAMAKKSKPPS